MIPTAFAAAYTVFPPNKRNTMSVLIGLIATMAPTIGPTLGGYLTQVFSWHWLFLINVVPGVLVAFAVWYSPAMDQPNRSLLKGFDAVGLAAMAIFLGSLEYVLEEGPGDDWFDDGTILFLSLLSVAGAAVFFWRSLSYRNPIVDLSAFANRNFASGSVFSFCVGVGLYGMVYLLPLYLATVRGLNSLQIGEMLFVTGLTQFLTAPIAGTLARQLDPRIPLGIGFVMMGISTWILSHMTADWDFYELMWPQILRGFGVMIAMIPVNGLALGTLPPDKLKSASGLYNLMRNLGGAVGLAALNTMLHDRQALHWSRLAESINPARPEVQATLDGLAQRLADQGVADPEQGALRVLAQMVQTQANVMSYGDAFTVLTVMFMLAGILIPFVRRPRRPAGAGGH
jgi:DHA2 family multidrug resistance protein